MMKKWAILRPQQWVKNFLLFGPIIFSQNFFNTEKLTVTFYGFLLFCGLASTAYIFNDLNDHQNDKSHPLKRHRPLAAGILSRMEAIVMALFLTIVTLGLGYLLDPTFALIGVIYLGTNVAYSSWLKHVVIIDVMVLASFYVIRVWAGAALIEVTATPWLIIATMLLALFLGFGKRRHEITQLGNKAESHRISLREYSPHFLDQMIAVVTSSTILLYIIYTLDETTRANFDTEWLPATIPFVLYGIFRYLYLIHQKNKGGRPTHTIVTDLPLLINVGLWALVTLWIIS